MGTKENKAVVQRFWDELIFGGDVDIADELLALELGRVVTRGLPQDVVEDERVVASYLGTSEEVIQRSGSA